MSYVLNVIHSLSVSVQNKKKPLKTERKETTQAEP